MDAVAAVYRVTTSALAPSRRRSRSLQVDSSGEDDRTNSVGWINVSFLFEYEDWPVQWTAQYI